MKINKILKRLLLLHPKSIDLSLDRIKRLLKDLNNPEKKIVNVIQVVGTNGKYSFCTTLREIYESAGYTVNMNISPSIRRFNERFYFSGRCISDEKLYDLLIEVEKINQGQEITFHEFITGCFFLAASRNKSDINIIESGLFFRLDASNVLDKNIASVVMPIGVDHINFLKKGTIDEIVYEKCSHLLSGSKIFIAKQKSEVLKKIKKNITDNTSKKIIFGENYLYKKKSRSFLYKSNLKELKLPLPSLKGDFQISNVCTAIATCTELEQFKVKEYHIKKAITKIRSEGRLQFISQGKLRKHVSKNNKILIDGAHNLLAAYEVEKYLKTLSSKKNIYMVLGMMVNKEHKKFIKVFKNKINSIIALDIPNQINNMKKEKLSKIAKSCGIPTSTESSIQNALKKISKENDKAIIFCTGSLYFVGEILNLN